MSFIQKQLLISLALIISSSLIGFKLASLHYNAKISALETGYAQAEVAAQQASAQRLKAAQSLADVLSQTLADSEAKTNITTLEKTRAITRYATSNICFKPDLTRLLNTASIEASTVPTPASQPAAEGESATAIDALDYQPSAEALTEADVAYWISNAQGQYATCRDRLGALIDFNNNLNNETE